MSARAAIRRLGPGLALAGCAAALALATPAGAATVDPFSDQINYFTTAGETNDLTLAHEGTEFVFTDAVAITAMAPCANQGANVARCPDAGIAHIDIDLGDMSDRATIAASVPPMGQPFDQDVFIEGDAGDDELIGGPNVENSLFGHSSFGDGAGTDTLIGGSLRDELFGSDNADSLDGGGDGDSLNGGGGADQMVGGAGDDQFGGFSTLPDGADAILGGPGFDRFAYEGREGGVSADPDDLADDGEGCPGAGCEGDNIGADVEGIQGGNGNDVLIGNDAHNDFFGDDGDDLIDGAGNSDFGLFGGAGADVINGGAGDDLNIFGGEGADTMDGGPGDDVLVSTAFDDDPDLLGGGSGLDLVDYRDANSAVRVDMDGEPDDGVEGEGDNVAKSVEDVFGSVFDDVLRGSKRDNELIGGDGRDKLVGSGGLDGLGGGRGADNINGGKGVDLLEGEAGADKLKSRDGGRDQVRCGSAVDKVTADRADRLTADCDKVKRRRK